MIFTKCFDINTGDMVDLAREVVDYLDYSGAYAFTPVDFSNINEFGNYTSYYSPYSPPDGSVITKAWITHGYVYINITEPDGRVLYVSFFNTRFEE
jgi:hypothetical protein